jgi:DNA-binding NarL/FixJ family response regulator
VGLRTESLLARDGGGNSSRAPILEFPLGQPRLGVTHKVRISSTNARVIIVDDSTALRQRLVKTLSLIPGLEIVGEAIDGEEAVYLIRSQAPKIVILDIQLAGSSGIHVLREVKHLLPATVVIMLTGCPYPQYQRECTKLGADHFLSKTSDFRQLVKLIERLASSE